jgi:hypothetical protein
MNVIPALVIVCAQIAASAAQAPVAAAASATLTDAGAVLAPRSYPMRAQDTDIKFKVFVFTSSPPEGIIDEGSKQRTDSVNDLRGALKNKRNLTVVDEKEAADVSIEVLDRGWQDNGKTTTKTTATKWTGIQSQTEPDQDMDLAVRLTAGSYETVLHSRPAGIVWRVHASEIAKKVDKWVRDNSAALLKLRGSRDW